MNNKLKKYLRQYSDKKSIQLINFRFRKNQLYKGRN